jgi:periplasmic protein TonB
VLQSPVLPEVFTAAEIARASGVSEAEVLALIEAGAIDAVAIDSRRPLVARREAVRAGRALSAGLPLAAGLSAGQSPALFSARPGTAGTARAPFAISTVVHAGMIAAVVVATTLGFGRPVQSADERMAPQTLRMVYLALPGPGGGGGGGGLKMQAPPPKAQRKGRQALSSPVPVRQPPPRPEPPRPEPPLPEVEPELLPPVQAPVVTAPADDREQPGVLEETAPPTDSRGQGTGGGVGTGEGTGVGEGEGSGLGDGSGGGTGGGPFRPGSGVSPPSLLREVKPDYTEEARRRGVEGDVVMEIVVRRDGSVGEVRLLQGLGHGLDARAVQAVREWRFSPGKRRGVPVDVLVEVAMEFKIR